LFLWAVITINRQGGNTKILLEPISRSSPE
jgi:hypothetical protein